MTTALFIDCVWNARSTVLAALWDNTASSFHWIFARRVARGQDLHIALPVAGIRQLTS